MVEVAARSAEEWICASGTGPRADWYRNLRVNGVKAVWIGAARRGASVRFLTSEEAAVVMLDYEKAHPKTASRLFEIMGVSYDGTDADRIRMMKALPMVAFSLD